MMKKIQRISMSVLALSALVFVQSCKENPELPDNLVEFQSDELGITADESEITITISLSREASKSENLVVEFESDDLEYDADFTTEPAATGNAITIPVESGASSVTFKVIKVEGVLYDGDEQVMLALVSVPESLVLGEKAQLTLAFAEIIAASGEMEIDGGGSLYPNKVFIDLSANRQTAVSRTTWDFGFSSGDEFRVILNSSSGMMARPLDKTDLNAVTAADTAGFGEQLSLSAVFTAITSDPVPDWVPQAITWIDDPTGDLSKTAIASVSTTASENKVYIVNRGNAPGSPAPELGWKKIRVLRNGDGYTLQHADIGASSFSEIQITKNDDYGFQYVSLATGAVTVEPLVARWDIAWTGFTNSTNFGSGPVPYYFQDIILQNRTTIQDTTVKTLQILTSSILYEDFDEADLNGLDFGAQNQIKIGSTWRSGGGPGSAPSIRTDRFYVIRDADWNYYKLRFTALTTNGERGKPRLEYALVKKGN